MSSPTLSIVVAASHAAATPNRCLAALAPQVTSDTEVLVVSTAPERRVAREFPFATWIDARGPRLAPELWGLGVERARGRIIALTVTDCAPSPGWIRALLDAHRAPHAAIGGPIANAPDARLIDRAVYFVRYTAYMPPLRSGLVDDIPGDNGSYKREALADWLDEILRHGFWEVDINRRLRRQGATLWMEAGALMLHAGSFSILGFSRQRFAHGRRFGAANRARMRSAERWARVVAWPLVPLLMLGRIAGRVFRRGDERLAFLLAVPLIVWFLACWSTGECVGLVRD